MTSSKGCFNVSTDTLHEIVNSEDNGIATLKQMGGVTGLAEKLHTSLSKGIKEDDDSEMRRTRIDHYSTNVLPEAEEVTFMDLVMESLEDRMMQILMVSAAISLVLGLTVADPATRKVDYAHGWIEGAAILLSVTLVTLVSALNNYQKEQKFAELTRATPPVMVSVVRAGKTEEISDQELLVGDLLSVAGGDVLTVDGLVLRSTSLKVDESAATGENDDVAKSSKGDCRVRSGTNVVEGEATVLVTGVGVNSFAGRIAMQVREAKVETPLQEKLTALADLIGYFGMAAASLMFVILGTKELFDVFVRHTHPFNYKKFLDNLTTAVTIVVVAVPEGLPLSVAIALAYSMKQMFKENNLVRHLAACETMGSATAICTDKTGTITQNEMTVTDGVTGYGTHFIVPVQGQDVVSPATLAAHSDDAHSTSFDTVLGRQPNNAALRRLLVEGIAVNTKSIRKRVENPHTHTATVKLTGSKTEQAMLNFVERLGEDPMATRVEVLKRVQEASSSMPLSPYFPVQSSWPAQPANGGASEDASFSKQIHVYPFTSARKRMTTALVLPNEDIVRFHVKGASELVLADCEYTLNAKGEREVLSHATREKLEDSLMTLARRRLRTLAIAYAEVSLQDQREGTGFSFPDTDEQLPGLTLIAIIGIRDPVRPEVPAAIARCRNAGVLVRMITGDNKATAVSIAKEVGIYGKVWSGSARGEQGLALEGPQFREFAKSERKLNKILPKLQVISRASPTDKQILVSALMKRGEVVAVTGDGTNDAPALKNANVGFSMNSGTEVAKNASDVIILDDNFSTIVTAMKWGRNVNDNISKFLQFQMTVNVAAVVVSFIGALTDASGESPLKPVQLLWVNLIMDTLAALALATESPRDDVLERHPKSKQAPLMSQRMWTNIIGQSAYQVVLQLWLLHRGHIMFGVDKDSEKHLTIVFNVFVLLQLFNEFNARILDNFISVLTGLTRAPLFLLVVGTCFVVQVVGVQYGGALMRAVPLTAADWQKCLLLSIVSLPLGIALRLMDVQEKPVPHAPVVVDEAEEATFAAAQHDRRRLTLKDAATKVIIQLKVVAAFASAASDGAAERRKCNTK